MKRISSNRIAAVLAVVLNLFVIFGVVAGASTFDSITTPIIDLINSLMTPLLAIVGALGSLYCVFLGVKYAKAEEPQDREKAKSHLKNAIIGFVLIFVLMLGIKLLMPIMTKWVADNSSASKTPASF